MGLESATEKLDKYFKRLEKGKAQKIKPNHVEKVKQKLEAKAQLLQADIADTAKEDKKRRLNQKLELVRKQLERASWLQDKISEP
jgi:molecular chaperone GrpE (heat shock protein)